MMLMQQCCPLRWIKPLETCIEKGKSPLLGKLWNLQLIEGDAQIMMHIFLLAEETENIENVDRFSKANYGSKRKHSIETAKLEKRLVFDHSVIATKKTICNLTHLKSCYDWQLPKLGIIIEESAFRNRNAMLLLTKILPMWKRCVCTGCGISTNWHGGLDNDVAGTGQDNKFFGDSCRDASCLIIKHVENKNLYMTIKSPWTNIEEQIPV